MPSIVATHLGVKGVVVSGAEGQDGNGVAKIKEFEKQPRGGLGTFARLDRSSSWLRDRNSLLKDFGVDGRARVLVCENGACHEEGLADQEPLNLSEVGSALPTTSAAPSSAAPETGSAVVGQAAILQEKESTESL